MLEQMSFGTKMLAASHMLSQNCSNRSARRSCGSFRHQTSFWNHGQTLLALIHSRTAFGPQDWLPIDANRVVMASRAGGLHLTFAEGCVVFQGPSFEPTKAWNQEIVHRHEACAPDPALAALEMYGKVLMGHGQRCMRSHR